MSPLAPGLVSVSVTTTGGTYKDLADFNAIVENWPDLLSGPTREWLEAVRPGRIDTAELDNDPRYKPADFQIILTVYARTSGYTVASMLTDLRNLKGWMARCIAIKVDAIETAMFKACKCTDIKVEDVGVVGGTPAMRVVCAMHAKDPLWYSTSQTSNALTTSLTEQALGTAPVRPVIAFTGAPSGLTLTYADSAGATVQTLTLAGLETTGATQTVVDMDALTVVQTISAVAANAVDTITSGDFFALDPDDADTVTPTWCKVKYALSGGSVSGVTCVYRKAYY